MNAIHIRSNARILTLIGVALLFASGLTINRMQAQTKPSETNSAVTADQQKQLNHLRTAQRPASKGSRRCRCGGRRVWFGRDRSRCRSTEVVPGSPGVSKLEALLASSRVSTPSAARNGGTVTQGTQNGRCGSRGCDHHCDGGHDCGHDGDHCCHGHCT